MLNHVSNTLKIHIVAIEYPGYGIYPGSPTARKILEDAHTVFDYFTEVIGYDPKDIMLFGRSLGSGPACELAAMKDPGVLVLMSAFTSIRGVVKSIGGKLSTFMVSERF